MDQELAKGLDGGILFVLQSRLSKALSQQQWDLSVKLVDLMAQVAARLGDGGGREYKRSVISLAKMLPTKHPREREFVLRASQFVDQCREVDRSEEGDADYDGNRFPIGAVTPLPLPVSGEQLAPADAIADIKTVRSGNPDLTKAIIEAPIAHLCTEVSYFPGWHLVEFQPTLPNDSNSRVASCAYFVKGDLVAPITGDGGVMLAIAGTGDFDISNAKLAKQYLEMVIAILSVPTGTGARMAEPGDPLPFLPGIDESIRAELGLRLEPCEIFAAEAAGYSARGTLMANGKLYAFGAGIGVQGEVQFERFDEVILERLSLEQSASRRFFYNYVYKKGGWRTLEFPDADAGGDAASDGEASTSFPIALPSASEGAKTTRARPCVVSPPGSTSFAGLPLHPVGEDERELIEIVGNVFGQLATDGFDIERAKIASLPFLPTHRLVLVPHGVTGVGVPFIVGNGSAQLVARVNAWLYQLMEDSGLEPTEEVVVPFARFFFAVVAGRTGRFTIVESVEEVPWDETASEPDRLRLKEVLAPIRYLGRLGDGRLVLSMHVVFKNALLRTNYEIARDWTGKLTKEDLILEDQPFLQGDLFDLVIS